MIFEHGFVHCDAHPGNILVRRAKAKDLNQNYQIVLLDHGLYRTVTKEFIKDFSNLWVSLIKRDKKQTQKYAKNLNI